MYSINVPSAAYITIIKLTDVRDERKKISTYYFLLFAYSCIFPTASLSVIRLFYAFARANRFTDMRLHTLLREPARGFSSVLRWINLISCSGSPGFNWLLSFYVRSRPFIRPFRALYFSIPPRRFNSPFLRVPEETEKVFLRGGFMNSIRPMNLPPCRPRIRN